MKRPNFFIVGAPKCGTTSLYEYLRSHPRIFMPYRKGLGVFLPHRVGRFRESPEEYESLFLSADQRHIAVGESCADYLYYQESALHIHNYRPDAKIVTMVRNPIDMARSLHAHYLLDFTEDEEDFERAWELQEARKKGERIPQHCTNPRRLQYSERCRVSCRVQRYVNVFSRQQVKVVVFDDFKSNAVAVYEDVLRFLGVPSDGRTEFPRFNPAKTHRFTWLAKMCTLRDGPWPRIRRAVSRMVGLRLRKALGGLLIWIYSEPRGERKLLSPEFRARLAEEFRDDVEKLGELIGRELSHWLE